MTFAELLTQYMRGLTLAGVSEACKAQGVAVSKPELSRWRSGERMPPKDPEVISTIATACGEDANHLLYLAELQRNAFRVLMTLIGMLSGGVADQEPRSMDELVNRFKGLIAASDGDRDVTTGVELIAEPASVLSDATLDEIADRVAARLVPMLKTAQDEM